MQEIKYKPESLSWVLIIFIGIIVVLIFVRNNYTKELRLKKRIKKREYKRRNISIPLSIEKWNKLILQKNYSPVWTEWIKDSVSSSLKTRFFLTNAFVLTLPAGNKKWTELNLIKQAPHSVGRLLYFAIVPLLENCSLMLVDRDKKDYRTQYKQQSVGKILCLSSDVALVSNHFDVFVDGQANLLVLCLSTFPLLD